MCLAFPCHAQDSITVVDRGGPPARIWSVVELPFKLLESPLRLLGGVAGWVANRAEAGGWVPAVRRVHDALDAHGIRPSVSGQGPNSGFGPTLRLGRGPDTSTDAWAYVQGGATLRGYWLSEARIGVRGVDVYARLEDRPREAFFGIGNGAREADWSDYQLRRASWGGRFTVRAPRRITLSANVEWTRVVTGRGTADDVPDIDFTFAPGDRPGFDATHRALSVSGGVAWSAGPRHSAARRGSFLSGGYRWSDSRTARVPDMGVLRASAGVEVPFDHRRRSIAAALSVESLRPASPGQVPFYALPTLGGAQSLPSFRSDRFRDRDVLLGKVEYRYRVWSDPDDALWADAVLFTYGGIVAERLVDELAGARLHQSTGFAVAVITRQTLLARIGVSKGADGVGLSLSMGGAF